MNYDRMHFNPEACGGKPLDDDKETIAFEWEAQGRRDVYVFEPRVTLAVNVALATRLGPCPDAQ